MKTNYNVLKTFGISFLLLSILFIGFNAMINNQKKSLGSKITTFLVYSKGGI